MSKVNLADKNTGNLRNERTVELAGDAIVFREVDSIVVVGRENPVAVFEPLGLPGEVSAEKLQLKEDYEKALAFYRDGDFSNAREILENIGDSDPVSMIMSERCLNYLAVPPDHWDGSFELSSK